MFDTPLSRYHENLEYVLIQPEEKERKALPCLILHLSVGKKKKKPAMVSNNASLVEEINSSLVLRQLSQASFSLLPMHQRREILPQEVHGHSLNIKVYIRTRNVFSPLKPENLGCCSKVMYCLYISCLFWNVDEFNEMCSVCLFD